VNFDRNNPSDNDETDNDETDLDSDETDHDSDETDHETIRSGVTSPGFAKFITDYFSW
jgi:hypothetical protein